VVVNAGAGTTTWRMVAVGDQFAVAIRTAGTSTTGGTLWAWGLNQNGQLGDGTNVSRSIPVQIGKDTDWAFIAAGKGHALAIKTSGILYSWGRNFNGQLGDGTLISKLVPTKIGTATWLTVSAGETHTLGLQKDGTLWAWGGNDFGQVGNAAAPSATPVQAPAKIGSSTWASVSAGAFHSLAISANGSLWAWGANDSSQLGDNGTTSVSGPKVILSDIKNWTVVAAGGTHTMGVRSDGTLWGWGSNAEGQLGNGDTDSSFPVQIGTGTNWVTVTSGAAHSFGLKTDNTLWGWGRNQEGQLGNGTKVLSAIPVNVPN
jgi:alpha-tubulin suppressor-like RCC1 family protein